MKFKFRMDKDDLLIFLAFALFLLLIVSIGVVNLSTFAQEGRLSGLNPFPAFAPEHIKGTLFIYFLCLGGLFISVNSYFFDREKGFGVTTEKKDKGYSRWAKEKEIKEELEMVKIAQENSKASGIPLILNQDEMWIDNSDYHSLVIGATGSGKTQTVILPQVHSLAKAKESMIITDPKGEIYEKTSNMLRARGYKVLLLNFRNPQNGNSWNPMALPYQMYKEGNHDKAIELLDDLALNILYDDSNKNQDPFWEKTSADYFSGVALGLFEDAKENEININSISLATTVGEEKFGGSTYIKEYFGAKDPNSAAAINASSTIMAPSETKGSILSVFKQKVKLFATRDNLSEMLSYSDIKLETIGERPTAVFIVIQDEKKTYHSLVTIFLKQVYETLIATAQRHGGKLPIRTNFLLDEFANMPPLKDVTTMITAARSRRIRFTMIIQNFAQLDSVYGKEDSETIRGNCGNTIYLITTELKALEEISKMCGEVKSKKEDKTASTPLVTVSDLQRMKQFEVIILRLRKQPFRTKFTPYFKINWGKKYPEAKYPTRPKHTVHTFDIKEFVKAKKKQKLLDMMKAADSSELDSHDKSNGPNKFGLPGANVLPFDGMQEPNAGGLLSHKSLGSSGQSFDKNPFLPPSFPTTVKDSSNPFESSPFSTGPSSNSTPHSPATFSPSSSNNSNSFLSPNKNESKVDSNLSFDVDELVKKIDAKIAQLEEEERTEKEKGVKDNNTSNKQEVSPNAAKENKEEEKEKTESAVSKKNIDLNDDIEDDDFFDDFFDN